MKIAWKSLIILFSFILVGCSTFQGSDKKAICNELKSRIIFNGATNDQRIAWEQRAEIDHLNTAYRNENCDNM